jgi:SAM-dependent methyltransferase
MSLKWKSPLYEITLASRKIIVNVSRSCPNFPVPTPGIPDIATALKASGRLRVLDFGAGKLRNTLFLLSKRVGFRITSVEFQECLKTPEGKRRLGRAQKFEQFFLKTWPHEFLRSDFEVDAVLLVNVANVIPEESDRQRVIRECTKRLRSGGWFLWMSQYGEPNYKPGVTKRLGAPDGGWFYNLDDKQQTYNRDFLVPEIKAYFSSRQYHYLRSLNAGHNRALLFEKL